VPSPTTKVRVQDVLTLCSELVTEAEQTAVRDRGPELIPVLIVEVERWIPLIEAATTAAEGVLVKAEEAAGGVPSGGDVRGSLPNLLSAVEATLKSLANYDPASYGSLSVEIDDDTAVVTSALPLASANRAQQSVRGVLSAVFHVDLRTGVLVALVWDDSALDSESSSLVFRLVQALPELLGLGPPTTLIALIGNGDLRRSEHCFGARGVRYRLTAAEGLQVREPHQTAKQRVRELARFTPTDAPLEVLLLGAGTSVNAGLPDGNSLRNRALSRRLGRNVDESNIWEAAEEFYEQLRLGGRLMARELSDGAAQFAETLTLERVLREEQHEENERLSATLRWFSEKHTSALSDLPTRFPSAADPLRRILSRRKQTVLVEVNFDQVVEERAKGLVRPFVTEEDYRELDQYLSNYKINGGLVPLLKLHGDIDYPDTIVANSDETAGGLSRTRLTALRTLRNHLGPVSPWWYIGYSMRDLDLNPIFMSPEFSDGLSERWVGPITSLSVRQFLERARLERWDAQRRQYTLRERHISLTAEEFWDILAEAVAAAP
jgi:hypothetical protein